MLSTEDELEVVGKKVLIVGVVAKPALNGQSGRVEAYASQQVEKVVSGLAFHWVSTDGRALRSLTGYRVGYNCR